MQLRATPPQRIVSGLLSFKADGDLRLDLDGLAIKVVRLVSPLPDGVEGSGREQKRAAQYLWIYDAAFLVDGSFDLDHALRMRRKRIPRILRFHALDEQSLRYSLRDFDFRQRRLSRGRSGSKYSAQSAVGG